MSASGILETLPSLVDEIGRGTFTIDAVLRPLADVEQSWSEPAGTRRIVLVP